MQAPRLKKQADSTLIEPDWRKLRLQVFASLCLFGFLFGLMLGKLRQEPAPAQLTLVRAEPGALELCFDRLPEITSQAGTADLLWLLQPVASVEDASGDLSLPDAGQVRWIMHWQQEQLRLGITAIGALSASWQPADNKGCVRLLVSRQTSGDANHQ